MATTTFIDGLHHDNAGTDSGEGSEIAGARAVGLPAARQIGTEGPDTLTGGAGNDRLEGLDGDDILDGGAGNDVLIGGGGGDRMAGGTGNDTYIVDSLSDRLEEGVDAGTDTVRTALTTYTLGANFEALRFEGASTAAGVGNGLANTMSGTADADTLTGLGGDDRLIGGGGNDVLIGGAGRDILDGGAGADRFQFFSGESAPAAADRVRDFDVDGGDVLDLSGLGPLDFVGQDAFGGEGTGEVRYRQQGGSTVVSGDRDGDGGADFAIALEGTKLLTEDDFVLAGGASIM